VSDGVTLRRADPGDGDALGDVWLDAWYATFDFPPAHPDADVRTWLRDEMLPAHEVWVATDGADRVVGFLALSDDMVDQLYIAPGWIGRGIGSRLIALAKERRPAGIDLYCFQVNDRARRFYESRGFSVIAEGDGSNNEEHQPDLRYAWRP
jgi:GNAT superfamily N-acetyltransferase